jgi:hypothetical protein
MPVSRRRRREVTLHPQPQLRVGLVDGKEVK